MTPAKPDYVLFLNQKPSSAEGRLMALLVVGASLLLFAGTAPFVRTPMPPLPAFIPAYESSLAVIEFLTSMLLLGQFLRGAATRVLVLACAYFFNTGMIVIHALSFPGVFAPAGIIGGGIQTTAWLYAFWHLGFPAFTVAFALMGEHAGMALPQARRAARIAFGSVVIAVLLIGVLCTAGHDVLPIIMVGTNYLLLVTKGISPAMALLCLAAIVCLARRRPRSVLDLWMGAVMAVWLLDIMMSAVLGSTRYDLGWYAGRLFGLLAGIFVLAVLLLEANKLHTNLADALALAHKSERDAAVSREELARGQRLEAIGQLTGGIAHDFNNVLQVVSASLNLLQFKFKGNADADVLVGRAMASVNRGARLASELLAFARRQPLRPKVINVATLLQGMAEVARRTLGQSTGFGTSIAPQLWNTLVDPGLLENAILNLAINARDAMDGEGRMVLGAENAGKDSFDFGPYADVPVNDYVRIFVKDAGCGIAPDVLPRIFEPFFTTKPISEGTGLGLSMVHGFAKQSAGHVGVRSSVGVGTEVSIFLPRSHQPVDSAGKKEAPAAAVGGKEAILVVDDHPDIRALAVQTLETLGYRVQAAHDAKSALKILESGERFDLLFSDVIMPGPVRTVDMATRAKQLLPELVVLYTSGFIDNALGQLGTIERDVHLLSKPYTSDALAGKIRELL